MARPLVSDELWTVVEPLLPATRPPGTRGRPPVSNRAALTGILFVLRTGIPWEYLPQELGCGCGMTCWRRLRDWQQRGVWERLHQVLLDRLGQQGRLDWSRASLDSSSIRAKKGGPTPGRMRPIAASPASSTTCWPSAAASPSTRARRRPTSRTPAN